MNKTKINKEFIKIINYEIDNLLSEAYSLEKARKFMSIIRSPKIKKRYENIMSKILYKNRNSFKSKRGDRIYVPFEMKSTQIGDYLSTTHKEIENELINNDVKIDDYIKGYGIDKYNRKVKIGQILYKIGREDLLKKFSNDKARAGSKSSDDSYIVFSTHPYDIGGASEGRGWTSCMELDRSGIRYLSCDVEEGSIIAYLIKPSDLNIENPISRIVIRPFVSIYDDKNIIYSTKHSELHGDKVPGFRETVEKIIADTLDVDYGKYGNDIYEPTSRFYNTSTFTLSPAYMILYDKFDAETKKRYLNNPDLLSDEDIKEILINKPEYIKYLKPVIPKLSSETFSEIINKKEVLIPHLIEYVDKIFIRFGDYFNFLNKNPYLIEKLDINKIKEVYLRSQASEYHKKDSKNELIFLLENHPKLIKYLYQLLDDEITPKIALMITAENPKLFDKYNKKFNFEKNLNVPEIFQAIKRNPKLFKHFKNIFYGMDQWRLWSYSTDYPPFLKLYIDSIKNEDKIKPDEYLKILYAVIEIVKDTKNHKYMYYIDDIFDDILKNKNLSDYPIEWRINDLIIEQPKVLDFLHKKNYLKNLDGFRVKEILKKHPNTINYFKNNINDFNDYDFLYLVEEIPELDITQFNKRIEKLPGQKMLKFLSYKPDELKNYYKKIVEEINYLYNTERSYLYEIMKKNPMGGYYFYDILKNMPAYQLKDVFGKNTTKGFGVYLKTIEKKYESDKENDFHFIDDTIKQALSIKPKKTINVLKDIIKEIMGHRYYSYVGEFFNDNPELKKLLN